MGRGKNQASLHVQQATRLATLTPEQRMAELEEAGQALGDEYEQLQETTERGADPGEAGADVEEVDAAGESAEDRAARLEDELAAAQAAAAPPATPEPAGAGIPAPTLTDDIQTESAEGSDTAPEQADPAPPESEAGQSDNEQEAGAAEAQPDTGPRLARKRR